jgi:FMN phosphatase YigB (HAD superfamily)
MDLINQLMLPFWNKVIFVDWHGVMSNSKCWNSIIYNKKHPLQESLFNAYSTLFMKEKDKVTAWMKGNLKSMDIIDDFNISSSDKRFKDINKYLNKKLESDCLNMTLNDGLVKILKHFSNKAFIVLATDNMDYFYKNVIKCKKKISSASVEDDLTFHFVTYFDHVLCSSQIGVLKSENSDVFFGNWLKQYNLTFENALLIDDSEKNCMKFKERGGKAYRIKNWNDDDNILYRYISLWIHNV